MAATIDPFAIPEIGSNSTRTESCKFLLVKKKIEIEITNKQREERGTEREREKERQN